MAVEECLAGGYHPDCFCVHGLYRAFYKKTPLQFLAGSQGDTVLASVLYYLLILPVYNVLLLAYGFLFGQFHFFWEFEKRFMRRILSNFKNKHK
jgi:hypothetical protein